MLGEDSSEPRIEKLRLTPDLCLLARLESGASFKACIGAEADLMRNIRSIAKVAGTDADEVGYLLSTLGETKQVR